LKLINYYKILLIGRCLYFYGNMQHALVDCLVKAKMELEIVEVRQSIDAAYFERKRAGYCEALQDPANDENKLDHLWQQLTLEADRIIRDLHDGEVRRLALEDEIDILTEKLIYHHNNPLCL